jgi:hypothetical protein
MKGAHRLLSSRCRVFNDEQPESGVVHLQCMVRNRGDAGQKQLGRS